VHILEIHGPEQSLLDTTLPDGGLPPVVGVQSFQVFRASIDVPEITDQYGWTYHHHVDMASWKGRLYVGWNSCERDEDVWPSRELYSTSLNGSDWTAPAELFPHGVSTCLRMYFYRASNDRMLAIAGLRTNHDDTDEDLKNALVVREIHADHTLGEVFTLQGPDKNPRSAPMFDTASDEAFIQACRQLIADRIYLEQQDRGRLLGDRRMKWHDAAAWPDGSVSGDNAKWVCGKAFSFFRRPDGIWTGVSKMGWSTQSDDDGNTWSQPCVPPSLITGKAKVWTQRTADGRYALVYNPSKSNRYPLVAVTSDDGINFGDMRVVHGELPIQRYTGLHRSIGPQYVRGISHWADDGSRTDHAMWLVYSMSKEDIWVSRVPLPIQADETGQIDDDFSTFPSGALIVGWNTYRPKWAKLEIVDGALHLESHDPYDYAQATRVFPETTKFCVSFDLEIDQPGESSLEIDILSNFGSHRLIQLSITPDGNVRAGASQDQVPIASIPIGRPAKFTLAADATRGVFSISINGKHVLRDAPLMAPAIPSPPLHRITLRTGAHRGIGGTKPVAPGTDHPRGGTSWRIFSLTMT
jgi:hypothetical protein